MLPAHETYSDEGRPPEMAEDDGRKAEATQGFYHPDERVTIFFTDIEGSTKLLELLGDQFEEALKRHLVLLRAAVLENGGREVDVHGDAYFAVFPHASGAVSAAVAAQRSLFEENWPMRAKVRVRMGLHTGNARLVNKPDTGTEYVGLDIHRAARICSIANGGQIVLSSAVQSDPDFSMPPGVTLRDLGTHRLKDIRFPEAVSDLVIEGLPSQFGPIRSLDNRPNNLPTALRHFVDREADKAALGALLQQEGVRLITLTGAGGTGKTRLSIEVARDMLDVFDGGIFQVNFAAVNLPGLVAPAVAQALSIHEIPGSPISETIKYSIGSRRMLLLLDNFEHLISAAPLVVELLDACPKLRVMITSREALGLSPEREYLLSPLHLPPLSAGSSPDELLSYDAVTLFVERVRDFRAEFSLTPESGQVISEICRRLDGLPLAIELAASRLRLFEPSALLRRLLQRDETLGKGSGAFESRHRSLRNAIGWSYDLLDPVEQNLFCRMSVFAGGFTLEAATSVAKDIAEESQILELLTSLIRKSLVQRGMSQGEVRLTMLQTIREFGLGKLAESDRLVEASRLHLEHMRALAANAASLLLGPQDRQGVAAILDEVDNLRAALDFAIRQRNVEATSGIIRSLLWFWIPKCQFTEGEAWIARALELANENANTAHQAAILDAAGWLKMLTGDWSAALPYFQQCRPIYENLKMPNEAAMSLMTEGITLVVSADDQEGFRNVTDALQRFRELGDSYGTALTLTALGEAARLKADYQPAKAHFDEALAIMRRIGNVYWIEALLLNLAQVSLQLSDWSRATVLLKEALEAAGESENPLTINYYIAAMARVALLRGMTLEAARLFGASSSFLKLLGAAMEPADRVEFDSGIAAAIEKLGAEEFQHQFAEGATWTREQAIAATLALHEN
jgi:predicted ATPase/class 3 adenylate cyclase